MTISKKIATLAVAAGALGAAHSAFAQANVGVSIGINQPGVYGQINIGNYPAPVLFNPQPVIIAPPPPARVVVAPQPIYLYVPEAHRLHWARYCGRYHACGQPVHFVRESWVRETWEREHRHDNGRHRGWDKDKGDKGGHGNHGDKHRRD